MMYPFIKPVEHSMYVVLPVVDSVEGAENYLPTQ